MRKILRSVYVDQRIDEALTLRAQQEGTTKAVLMRDYIAAGLTQPARGLFRESGRHEALAHSNYPQSPNQREGRSEPKTQGFALYVYTEADFQTNTIVHSLGGATFGPGLVTLPAGIYRLGADARLTPRDPEHSVFDLVAFVRDGELPDPPRRAEKFVVSPNEIMRFLLDARWTRGL